MDKSDAGDRWSVALGHAWAEQLHRRRLSPSGTVVEIGPGFGDKVARALAALDFRGRVVLVEPNGAAAAWARDRYRDLLPRAEVLVVARPVPVCNGSFGRRVDALLANHILDDLILDAALRPDESAKIFSRMTAGSPCSRAFVAAWHGLLSHSYELGRVTSRAAEIFTNYVAVTRPRLVLLNQYPSFRHDHRGLGSIHTQALRLMDLLEEGLGAVCMDSAVRQESGGSYPVRWLLGKGH